MPNLVDLVRGGTAEEVVEALATWPGGVSGLSPQGESPLVACAEVGRVKLLKAMLAAGASPDAASSSGLTALAAASMVGALECTVALLAAGATPDLPTGRARTTPLSYAAQEGFRGVCEALLNAGADATAPDSYGVSPQQYALRRAEERSARNAELHTWMCRAEERAEALEAEPTPARPLFPTDLKASLEECHSSSLPTSILWRAGPWIHEQQGPSASVVKQREPRPFSCTGFGVSPPDHPVAASVLPGGRMADLAIIEAIDDGLRAKVALERSAQNPQLYADDVQTSVRGVQQTCLSVLAVGRLCRAEEARFTAEHPEAAKCIRRNDGGGVYYGEMQKELVAAPNAAVSLVPIIEGSDSAMGVRLGTTVANGVPADSLVEVLQRAREADDGEEESSEQ